MVVAYLVVQETIKRPNDLETKVPNRTKSIQVLVELLDREGECCDHPTVGHPPHLCATEIDARGGDKVPVQRDAI